MNETAAAAGVISNMTTSHWTDDFDADVVDGRNDDRVDVGRLGEELP